MKAGLSRVGSLVLIVLLGAASCSSARGTPSAEGAETRVPTPVYSQTEAPPATQAPLQAETPQPVEEPADTIFCSGTLITMEESQPLARAIALRGGLIQAVGTDQEVLSLRGPDTAVVDLQGYTMMPGFIDGHTHILAFPGRMGRSLADAQETALRCGFTGVSEMWADQGYLDTLLEAERDGSLRLRVNVFPSYNDGVLAEDHARVMLQTWYPEHGPILDPSRRLRIPGIKIFVDGDNSNPSRGCWALSDPYLPGARVLNEGICGTDRGDLYWTQDEINQAVAAAQAAGYRVAFHAMGDRAIETALNAIEHALDGQPNERYRHQIEHNSLARPDLLPRYQALGVLASVRGYGDFCDLQGLVTGFGQDRYPWYANRYALPGLGIHAYIETDFGWTVDPDDRFSQRGGDPIVQLYGIVTHRYVAEDGSICEPDPVAAAHAISVGRALQMLTIEPAYAVSMEDHIGSLRPGKYADLILLSGNPLAVDPGALKDLQVWMTLIGGQVEYCAPGKEAFRPGAQPAGGATEEDLPASGNLALNQAVTASTSLGTNPPAMAVDGDEATYWGSGDLPPQWIEVDLGAPATITEIRLRTSQSPAGDTVHRVLVRGEVGELVVVHQFEQLTGDGDWLVYTPEAPLEKVRAVRIETVESPSWVSWFEVQAIGAR